jgi:enoyl-CoA hydratase/carnithine racemase
MSFETIIYEKEAPIATITLNRPDKLNALSDELQAEVRQALEDAGWDDDDIRVIVLKAAGRAFSAGFDISGGERGNAADLRHRFLQGKGFSASAWWDVFWDNPKPIIAQIQGFCIAGGLATATFCDLRARELLYTGNLIDAEEARRLDLVNQVVPADQLDDLVRAQALTIAKLPAKTVEYNKKLINMSYELMGVRQVLERSYELEAMALASSESSPEIQQFQAIQQKDGLNAALAWNAERFREEDAWFRKDRKRS